MLQESHTGTTVQRPAITEGPFGFNPIPGILR